MANNYPKGFKIKIAERDNKLCCLCRKSGYELHHIHFGNLRKGRVHEEKEVVLLCRTCHEWCHKHKKRSIELCEKYINYIYK